MIISKNLKNKIKKAKITHVASTCSNHYNTNYYHFLSVDEILKTKNGESLSYGRYNGITEKMFRDQNPGSNFCTYQELFKN